MYNSDTELMFPLRVATHLANQRSEIWKAIVDQITASDATIVERAAFTLMMVRLGGCQGCSVDSFRGMRGCTACAKQTVKRFRGGDSELETLFVQAKKEIEGHLAKS